MCSKRAYVALLRGFSQKKEDALGGRKRAWGNLGGREKKKIREKTSEGVGGKKIDISL